MLSTGDLFLLFAIGMFFFWWWFLGSHEEKKGGHDVSIKARGAGGFRKTKK